MAQEQNFTNLLRCIATGDIDHAKTLLSQDPVLVEHVDNSKANPLYIACDEGLNKFVELLLQFKADPYALHEKNGLSPLHAAVKKGHLLVVQSLLSHDPSLVNVEADITAISESFSTPLHFAADSNPLLKKSDPEDDVMLKIVDLLIQAGADVNKTNKAKKTPLWKAASMRNLPMVTKLLKHGATPNIADNQGITPLLLAASHGCATIIKHLIDVGHALTDCRDNMGDTVLHHAAQVQLQRLIFNYNMELTEHQQQIMHQLIVVHNVNPTVRNNDNDTALDIIDIPVADVFDHVILHRENLSKIPGGTYFELMLDKDLNDFKNVGIEENAAKAFLSAIGALKKHQFNTANGAPCTLVDSKKIPYKRKFKHLFINGTPPTTSPSSHPGLSKCPVTGKTGPNPHASNMSESNSHTLNMGEGMCPVTGKSGKNPHPQVFPAAPSGSVQKCPFISKQSSSSEEENSSGEEDNANSHSEDDNDQAGCAQQ